MTDIAVHSVPGSPFGRAVLATLEEKAVAYRFAAVAPGTLRSEPHIARHPFGRIPVFEDDGFLIYETQAILRHIDRTRPTPNLTPTDPKSAARMEQIMNICDWYVFQGVNNVIGFQRIVGPRLRGLTPDEALIAEAMPRAHQVFNELARLLGDKPYFASDQPTLADLMVAPHLDFLSQTPEWSTLTAALPNLVAWLDRVTVRPSFQATTWERVAALAAAA